MSGDPSRGAMAIDTNHDVGIGSTLFVRISLYHPDW